MKKIGLVGGISWTSTVNYYKHINEIVNRRLGGLESCECIIYSLNFGDIQRKGWLQSYELLYKACCQLVSNDVEGIALCANTAHLFIDKIIQNIEIPIIDIIVATTEIIKKNDISKVGILGTRFTMQMDFYFKLLRKHGITAIAPTSAYQISKIHNIVKNELGMGIVKNESKNLLIKYAQQLSREGAEAIVLACTELSLALTDNDFNIPIFDTTQIHANAIVDFILD